MLLYRLGTAQYTVWDGAGASQYGGRWNRPGAKVIYAAGSLALAMLERLVQRRSLGSTLLVEAIVPDDMQWEDTLIDPPPGWRAFGSAEAVAAGTTWFEAGRTALLRVPSALVPREPNWVINAQHPDAGRIQASLPEALQWDPRLFGIPIPSEI